MSKTVKYHINPKTAQPNKCQATVRTCAFAVDGQIPVHYDTPEEAQKAVEKILSSKFQETMTGVTKGNHSKTVDESIFEKSLELTEDELELTEDEMVDYLLSDFKSPTDFVENETTLKKETEVIPERLNKFKEQMRIRENILDRIDEANKKIEEYSNNEKKVGELLEAYEDRSKGATSNYMAIQYMPSQGVSEEHKEQRKQLMEDAEEAERTYHMDEFENLLELRQEYRNKRDTAWNKIKSSALGDNKLDTVISRINTRLWNIHNASYNWAASGEGKDRWNNLVSSMRVYMNYLELEEWNSEYIPNTPWDRR